MCHCCVYVSLVCLCHWCESVTGVCVTGMYVTGMYADSNRGYLGPLRACFPPGPACPVVSQGAGCNHPVCVCVCTVLTASHHVCAVLHLPPHMQDHLDPQDEADSEDDTARGWRSWALTCHPSKP